MTDPSKTMSKLDLIWWYEGALSRSVWGDVDQVFLLGGPIH